MQKEQTVIAHFPSSTKADTAVKALANMGITDVSVRRNSRFGVSNNSIRDDSLNLQAHSLTGLTAYSSDTPTETDKSTRVLMAADPSISGMSSRGYGMAGGRAFTLVAFVPPEQVEAAVSLIKQNGGLT